MVTFRHSDDLPPIEIRYSPQRQHRLLPVEVLDRGELLQRIEGRELAHRQRADFHQLFVCTSGTGVHSVDYEPIELSAGMLLRTYPGQVQQYVPGSNLEAFMVIWPHGSHQPDPDGNDWYPGSNQATHWHLVDEVFAKVQRRVEELQREQERFDGSSRNVALMEAMLGVLLLRLAMEFAELEQEGESQLPLPYIELRSIIEKRLYERPAIGELASDLGYSSRTLDRACQQVSGQTAKQVLDERIALEIQRLLTHSTRPIPRVAADFGFNDASNFSKFVKRHLDRLPRQVRDGNATTPR